MSAPATDGRDGGPPPRPAAPAGDRRPQWFTFGPWLFDVRAAMRLLRRAPRPAQPLPAALWARAYGLIPDPGASPRSIPLLGPGPGFDRDYAMTTDLTKPLIIATVPVPGGPPAALLIDGTHRLYKAHATGAARLPAWVLTETETLTIRAPRGSRAARRPCTGRSGR